MPIAISTVIFEVALRIGLVGLRWGEDTGVVADPVSPELGHVTTAGAHVLVDAGW